MKLGEYLNNQERYSFGAGIVQDWAIILVTHVCGVLSIESSQSIKLALGASRLGCAIGPLCLCKLHFLQYSLTGEWEGPEYFTSYLHSHGAMYNSFQVGCPKIATRIHACVHFGGDFELKILRMREFSSQFLDNQPENCCTVFPSYGHFLVMGTV